MADSVGNLPSLAPRQRNPLSHTTTMSEVAAKRKADELGDGEVQEKKRLEKGVAWGGVEGG